MGRLQEVAARSGRLQEVAARSAQSQEVAARSAQSQEAAARSGRSREVAARSGRSQEAAARSGRSREVAARSGRSVGARSPGPEVAAHWGCWADCSEGWAAEEARAGRAKARAPSPHLGRLRRPDRVSLADRPLP
uniref:hypothetical protein n=1 Tax=Nonomuraea pusilla TaxID=46177 RepID=UPI00128EDCA5|nr:hypothetical protein [Nonomuraea pusilla]